MKVISSAKELSNALHFEIYIFITKRGLHKACSNIAIAINTNFFLCFLISVETCKRSFSRL